MPLTFATHSDDVVRLHPGRCPVGNCSWAGSRAAARSRNGRLCRNARSDDFWAVSYAQLLRDLALDFGKALESFRMTCRAKSTHIIIFAAEVGWISRFDFQLREWFIRGQLMRSKNQMLLRFRAT